MNEIENGECQAQDSTTAKENMMSMDQVRGSATEESSEEKEKDITSNACDESSTNVELVKNEVLTEETDGQAVNDSVEDDKKKVAMETEVTSLTPEGN